jgi:hypothetical protein
MQSTTCRSVVERALSRNRLSIEDLASYSGTRANRDRYRATDVPSTEAGSSPRNVSWRTRWRNGKPNPWRASIHAGLDTRSLRHGNSTAEKLPLPQLPRALPQTLPQTLPQGRRQALVGQGGTRGRERRPDGTAPAPAGPAAPDFKAHTTHQDRSLSDHMPGDDVTVPPPKTADAADAADKWAAVGDQTTDWHDSTPLSVQPVFTRRSTLPWSGSRPATAWRRARGTRS